MRQFSDGCFQNTLKQMVLAMMLMLVLSLSAPAFLTAGDDTALATSDDIDFTAMSFEELKNVVIISASKKPEKLSEADAAVFVITQDDIRRSGVTTIADALRLAPGVQVARVNTHGWAISIRGFNEDFAGKLLVLIDGRSVYSPIYSGVFWDLQDTVLEDIDRIEIIRGPGSALWGANAVNGVINIITKPAKDTKGVLVTNGNGTYEKEFASVRYGGAYQENLDYRIYAKGFNRDEIDHSKDNLDSGNRANADLGADAEVDNWWNLRGGFRMDWTPESSDSVSLLGEAYFNRDSEEVGDETETRSKTRGGHLVSQWRHTVSETSDTLLQFYYDETDRNSQQAKYVIRTVDLDFQHRFSLWDRHEITWGMEYRFISDNLENFYLIQIDPDESNYSIFNSFVQDEINFFEERVRLTIGTKFENSEFSDFVVQPSVRILWKPGERHSFWGAVSRATTVPSRIERDGTMLVGRGENWTEYRVKNNDVDSEKVTAFETGYRMQPKERLFLDFAIFYNDYDDLRTWERAESPAQLPGGASGMAGIRIGSLADNKMEGVTYGFEIAADWLVIDQWRVRPAYSYLKMELETEESTDFLSVPLMEGSSPKHQFTLLSTYDVTKSVDFDVWLRWVDDLPAKKYVEEYTEADVRLAWRPVRDLELSLTGQNLLNDGHSEFSALELERSVYFKVTWRH